MIFTWLLKLWVFMFIFILNGCVYGNMLLYYIHLICFYIATIDSFIVNKLIAENRRLEKYFCNTLDLSDAYYNKL